MLTGNAINGEAIYGDPSAELITELRHPSLYQVFADDDTFDGGNHITRSYAHGRLIWNGMPKSGMARFC